MCAKSMKPGAINALGTILDVRKGKKVLVITDDAKLPIGKAFMEGAEELGAETQLYTLPHARPIKEVPLELVKLVDSHQGKAQDVIFINAFSGIGAETPMRISLIQREIATGARVGHAPGIDESMMTEGPMNVDYRAVAVDARKLMKKFKGAATVHITSPSGTDITLNIEGREFETDVEIRNGSMGNLPAGEIWCAPVEDGANGVIFTDGSIGDIGAVKKPLKLTVVKGKLEKVSGGTPALMKKLKTLLAVDANARVIGELGIGLNPGARITGNLLEDEKAGRTAHIAFGNNTEMPSGKNDSLTHRDFLFHRPNIEVTFTNGKKVTLITDGNVVP